MAALIRPIRAPLVPPAIQGLVAQSILRGEPVLNLHRLRAVDAHGMLRAEKWFRRQDDALRAFERSPTRWPRDIRIIYAAADILTTTNAAQQSYSVPADFATGNNQVEIVAPGGAGSARQSSSIGGTGGAGGEYINRLNVPLEPGNTTTYLLSAGGTPGGTQVDPFFNPRNLLIRSQEFDNATWSPTGATISADTTTAPDGTSTADSLVEDATNGQHLVGSQFTTIRANTNYCWSCYIKPSLRTFVSLQVYATGFGNNVIGDFDLTNGTVTGSGANGAGASVIATDIQSAANGFFRCSLIFLIDASSTTAICYVQAATGSGVTTYVGSNGSTALFAWGAQLEPRTVAPSDYVSTTTTAAYSGLAKAGGNGTTSAAGVHQTGGQGDTVNEAGDGFKPGAGVAIGGGGGGSAGPNGTGSTSTGSQGAAADNGTVTTSGSTNVNGGTGTEFDGTHGCGAGASGRSGNGGGFTGGNYGGGGSGTGTQAGQTGGSGAQSIIVVTNNLDTLMGQICL